MGIRFRHSGSFDHIEKFCKEMSASQKFAPILERYGKRGVDALAAATPKRTGFTAGSWSYAVEYTNTGFRISWSNSNVIKGVNIALILEYGHGTRNGGYVRGREYINSALQSVMDALADELWKEVTSS